MKEAYTFGLMILFFLFSTIGFADKKEEAGRIEPPKVEEQQTVSGQQEDSDIPSVIKSASCIGEVNFPHEFHFSVLEIDCQECHHETDATALDFPHEDYFKDFWIDCGICHRQNEKTTLEAQTCSNCHHSQPSNIADETLSAEVVIHKSCWNCHSVGKGKEASQSCAFCHSGPKMPCW